MSLSAHIPLIDLDDEDWPTALTRACETIGFAALNGHGIALTQFAAMRELCEKLFAIDANSKCSQAITRENYRGFIPLGFFTPNRQATQAVSRADEYEGYKLHWECPQDHPAREQCRLYGANRWPPQLPSMEALVMSYWSDCEELAARLLTAFARGLGLQPAYLTEAFNAPLSNMTLLHYPAGDGNRSGIHPHRDTCALTLLYPDPAGGLDVQTRDGDWIEARCPPGALLMNVGEMLEVWSGGRYVATPHRVVNRSGRERYAWPWFAVPNHAVIVEPLLPPQPGFRWDSIAVGPVTEEVWRTNWPDETARLDIFVNPTEASM